MTLSAVMGSDVVVVGDVVVVVLVLMLGNSESHRLNDQYKGVASTVREVVENRKYKCP